MLKNVLNKMYDSAARINRENIEKSLTLEKQGGKLLDLGCWDGEITQQWIRATNPSKVYGLEIDQKAANKAKINGIKVNISDLDKKWPYKNDFFDYIVSNIVIEHVGDVDNFISESYRVLKNGGVTVVATNNLASWHNIFCLTLAWAPFDMSNSSERKWSIGNPLALHADSKTKNIYGDTWVHKCVYTPRWLKEWYELYGFKHQGTFGAGYFPLPAYFGKLDTKHASLMTLKFRK